MNNEEKFLQCLEAARKIVETEKALFPGCEGAINGDFGGSSDDIDTSFSRTGTSVAKQTFDLPSALASKLAELYIASPLNSQHSVAESTFLQNLLSRLGSSVPQSRNLIPMANMAPSDFIGADSLDSIIARNPYSQSYEQATQDLFDRSYATARAAAMSGPSNVRGGTARAGFELADLDTQMSNNRFREVSQQQQQQAGITNQAVSIANAIDTGRRGQSLQAIQQLTSAELGRDQQGLEASGAVGRNRTASHANLALASQILGKPTSTVTDNMSGEGDQSGNSTHWGVNLLGGCCFIFLEVLNGELPWFVREARDYYCTENRRKGYVWMSSWLVPLMKKNKKVRGVVNALLVKPFIRFGTWRWMEPDEPTFSRHGWMLWPYVQLWFKLWDLCGLISKGKKLCQTSWDFLMRRTTRA